LILVSGNQSGDLDSLVCAYVKNELVAIRSKGTEKILSLFNFPRSRWHLRSEAEFLFQQNDLSLDKIIFKDELGSLDLKDLFDNHQLKIILVDHNQIEKELYPYKESIIEIVDHHRDCSEYPHNFRRTIVPTGSCATLIAEQFLEMLKNQPESLGDIKRRHLANLLYSTIRIDTDHLKDHSGYILQRDYKALEELRPYTDISGSFINKLTSIKYDLGQYSTEDLLYKDYKQWECNGIPYGFSTVFFDSMSNSEKALEAFIKKENILILFLMHFLKEPILKREFTVAFSPSFQDKNELLKAISDSGLFKELSSHTYLQINPELSRKKIQPFIEKLLKELKE